MGDAELLRRIRATASLAAALASFDFDLSRAEHGPPEPVHLPTGEPLEMVAGDAAGGAFLLAGTGEHRKVVYVGSEGSGGLVAGSLREALALVVGLSSIHDATALALDDGGVRLRRWLAQADEEIRADRPDLDTERARLRVALDLPPADGLLPALHAALADPRYRPVSDHGDTYESMLP